MKRQLLLASLLALVVAATGFGQPPRGGIDFRRMQLSGLSLEEQAKLRSAHDMAMRDPALLQSRARYEQARREFRDRLRDALLKADPTVQPILEKAQRQRHHDR
jgi:secreted protein with Ig-like and vWFA domain